MKVVILAAGKGSRLGDPHLPKPLTLLESGLSILDLQLQGLSTITSLDNVLLVVGFHKEKITEKFPNLAYITNANYAHENTSKSLLKALRDLDDDVLWLNGDVVFHPSILKDLLQRTTSGMIVNTIATEEEEVKYRTNGAGQILEVSKTVQDPEGEALGINFFAQADLSILIKNLERCEPHDYFEKGIELSIQQGVVVETIPIESTLCTEIDFPEDLVKANALLKSWLL